MVLFSLLSVIFLIFLAALVLSYFKSRGHGSSVFDRKFQQIQKSYGTRIAESKGNQLVGDKNPIPMNSIEDLMKIADELGKPVIHQSEELSGDTHIYYVIDGNTRYQYALSRDMPKQTGGTSAVHQ
jgi:hypothetical protein